MCKKLGVTIFLTAVIAIFIGVYMKYWQEPTATYVETNNPKLVQVRKDLSELKAELRAKGQYNCCIKNDCNWCLLHMGHCPCAKMVQKNGVEKSCPECAAAWNRKQGKIPGVDPDAVQVTTFGIYGFEKGGHHNPGFKEHGQEETGQHNLATGSRRANGAVMEYKLKHGIKDDRFAAH